MFHVVNLQDSAAGQIQPQQTEPPPGVVEPCTSQGVVEPCTSQGVVEPCTSQGVVEPCTSQGVVEPCTSQGVIEPCTSQFQVPRPPSCPPSIEAPWRASCPAASQRGTTPAPPPAAGPSSAS
uniref:Uncharacterized protein n=1 Tax=Amphiprion percula TaxID=161767 RepID=A0A3P8TQZ7_AMPPE